MKLLGGTDDQGAEADPAERASDLLYAATLFARAGRVLLLVAQRDAPGTLSPELFGARGWLETAARVLIGADRRDLAARAAAVVLACEAVAAARADAELSALADETLEAGKLLARELDASRAERDALAGEAERAHADWFAFGFERERLEARAEDLLGLRVVAPPSARPDGAAGVVLGELERAGGARVPSRALNAALVRAGFAARAPVYARRLRDAGWPIKGPAPGADGFCLETREA